MESEFLSCSGGTKKYKWPSKREKGPTKLSKDGHQMQILLDIFKYGQYRSKYSIFYFLSSTNLETKSCQTVAGGEYESRRSRVEQVFLLFFLYIPKFVQNDKKWISKLQFHEILFSAAVASAASRCDEHLR